MGKIHPSSASPAREQPPDLLQGSWRWFKFLAKIHLDRMVHHTPWNNIKETHREKQISAKISVFCDVCFFVLSVTNFLNWLQISHQPGHTEVILEENMSFYPNSNNLLPGLKSETWTLCQSLCDVLVRTIDLFLWNTVLSYHQPHFSLVPRNPASLAVHGHSNWKTDSVGEKASKNPLWQ